MTDAEVDTQAIIIWGYMQMHQQITPCDVMLVLCSFDTRIASYAAELYMNGFAPYIIISGSGKGRITEQLFEKSEADTFADIMMAAGVPKSKMIIEPSAVNTGENIRFTYALMKEKDLHPSSLLVIQKPYMERRVYATFKKQWPDQAVQMIVTSPPIPYADYFDKANDKHYVIEAMLGDLQRIKLYGENGYQIPQKIPANIWNAYEQLVAAGFTRRLILDKTRTKNS